ncbi:hypothetical protein FRC06_006951, partial [Ceratobasidium sp. 370]
MTWTSTIRPLFPVPCTPTLRPHPQHPCPRPHPSSTPAPPQADHQDVEPAPTAHGPARRASTTSQNIKPAPAANADAAEHMQCGHATESATPTTPATPAPCSSTCIVVLAAKTPDAAEATTSTKHKAPMGGKAATMHPAKKAATKGKAAAKGKTAAAKGKTAASTKKGKAKEKAGAKGKGKAKEKGKGKGKAIDEDDKEGEDKEDEAEDKEDKEDKDDTRTMMRMRRTSCSEQMTKLTMARTISMIDLCALHACR